VYTPKRSRRCFAERPNHHPQKNSLNRHGFRPLGQTIMKPPHRGTLFKRVLVPILHGCDQKSALAAASAIAGRGGVEFVGLVPVTEGASLSTAAKLTQGLRKRIQQMQAAPGALAAKVYATHAPWPELLKVVEARQSDLLVLEWPAQVAALQTTLAAVLVQPPCDVAIVNALVGEKMRKVLLPLRGGPYAELALRIALSIRDNRQVEVSSLHLYSGRRSRGRDAAFRGIERVLGNLPQIGREEIVTDNPQDVILERARGHDLVILGASAQPANQVSTMGAVAARIMEESHKGVIVVKTRRPPPASPESEEAGQAAISVLVDKWFAENTYEADEFRDLGPLLRRKKELGLSISLALPALDEEKTLGNVIRTIQNALMLRAPLLDEMVLIDSNSTDRTREIAESLGVSTYIHQQVLPQYGGRPGKGEALWKSLYCTRGDILIWLDTDIVNMHPRFVYGLIGPLLLQPELVFVKGFYRRPLKVGRTLQAVGGGRVTELTARPLLNLFYPELSGVLQPLAGEYGGRRTALEQLPFFSGYGVEVGLLIDVFEHFGLHAIAQVNLQERVHHNQPLEILSKMSFAIIQAVIRKVEGRYDRALLESVNKTMKLIRYEKESFSLAIEEIAEKERPPIVDLPEYRERFGVPEAAETRPS
jgi:glucosyl-3-phosphoglycerate synthase